MPSESAVSRISRLTKKLSESNALERVQEELFLQAIQEGFVTDDVISIDSLHLSNHGISLFYGRKSRKQSPI